MLSSWKRYAIIILILLLSGCNSDQDLSKPDVAKEPNNPYKQLSTKDLENQQSEAPIEERQENQNLELVENLSEMEPRALQKTVPEEEPSTEPESSQEEQQEVEQGTSPIKEKEQAEVPEDQVQQGLEDQQESNQLEDSQEEVPTGEAKEPVKELPFENFKERWNAITVEHFSNLYIRDLQRMDTEDGQIYSTKLNNQLDLKVYVEDGYIQSIEMVRKGTDKTGVATMLTGWMQVVKILHPDIQIYDVDTLFHDIGVGPNGDLSKVKRKTITYNSLNYEVIPEEKSLLLGRRTNNGSYHHNQTKKKREVLV